ncbi:hypothetical protein [Halioxenophilus sp. WMMB6]|uniref:hypothetical protein n=1 Tax=Halioxenophilus sp. WMMB6 TaxID=3073815 RepID=UPI00295E59AC|nr:hypothetical protein [Halioxenophilus sp. WMMB6]
MKNIAFLLSSSLLLSGCVNVTTYGQSPRQVAAGQYIFTLYYNAYASDESIDEKAAEITESIRVNNHHTHCTFSRPAKVSPWQVKELEIKVDCD